MKVELLLAFEDKTWDTETVEVPDALDSDSNDVYRTNAAIVAWAERELGAMARYRKVVLFGVYHYPTEEPDLLKISDAMRAAADIEAVTPITIGGGNKPPKE